MKQIRKRFLALAVCLSLLLGLVPAVQAAQTPAGVFYFTAMTANNTVVEPVAVPYTNGQTVLEALQSAGYELEIVEGGAVVAINGTAASYLRFYDGGGYDMGVSASTISAMLFCVNPVYSEEMLDLICAMGAYHSAANHVQNDPDASSAYRTALTQMRNADAAEAKRLCDSLTAAVQAYEKRMNGEKYAVSFQVTQNGAAVSNAPIKLTDAYGNVTEGTGSVQVVAGNYTYCVSDGGVNRTEGTVEVTRKTTVTVTLPGGQWFDQVRALCGDYLDEEGNKHTYRSTQNENAVTWYVDDASDGDSVYLYATQGAVPSTGTTKLYARYVGIDQVDYSARSRSWSSPEVKLSQLLDLGMEGRRVTLEACYTADAVKQYQRFDVEIVRVPTLKSLSVSQTDGPLYLPFSPMVTDYTLRATGDTVTIDAAAFTAEGTTVTVNGDPAKTVSLQAGDNPVEVTVSHTNGQSRTYRLVIQKCEAAAVTLEVPAGVQAQVQNLNGEIITPQLDDSYLLIPGDTYVCLSTVGSWYHASKAFVAENGLQVAAPTPEQTDFLTNAAFYNRRANSVSTVRTAYVLDQPFAPENHSYTMPISDSVGAIYVQATTSDENVRAAVHYQSQSTSTVRCGLDTRMEITQEVGDTIEANYLERSLTVTGYAQTFTIRAQKQVGEVTHYQDYLFSAPRRLHLSALSGTVDGETLELLDADGNVTAFDPNQLTYSVQLLGDAQRLTLCGEFPNVDLEHPLGGGYYALVNGQRYDSLAEVNLEAETIADGDTVTIQICHADTQAVSQTYTLTISKVEPVPVMFNVTPADATVFMTNNKNGMPVYAGENGAFSLIPGNVYTYHVTASGYAGKTLSRYTAPDTAKTVTVKLNKAAENTTLPDYTAQWPSFRQDGNNNGVVSAATPTTASDAVLYWAKKVGLGWYGDACGCPILVDDHIYIYAGKKLFKLDKNNGEVVAEGDMDHSSNFAITNAAYGDGMIFVGLSNGSVQAFNAETLESLWLYEDVLGGQPNCPIAYRDGYVYTGFWISETAAANFVCLPATDEDPKNTMEKKVAAWTYTAPGGFYWSGAYVNDDFVLIGTDDGEHGNSKGYASLLCLDRRTGTLLSSRKLDQTGDVRCSITYDAATDGYYFTTKGGYFYRAQVSDQGQITALTALKLSGGSSSTPTIYNGRAYIGVSGSGAYGAYSGHNISVIDLRQNMEIIYQVPTQGNPQTSGVLTTAYDSGDGTVYVYFLDNYTPGKLRVIRDRMGQTEPMDLITEQYKGQDYQVAPVLFTPYDKQTQYAICSPVVDSDGTLYFKNDSGYLMAVGTEVTKLTLAAAPEKLTYHVGEPFDPTGMKVTAAYKNGAVRDVTSAIVWNEEALTLQDTTFDLVLPMAYRNGENGQAGIQADSPVLSLDLKITEPQQEPENPSGKDPVDPPQEQPLEMPFDDVADNAWYYDEVAYVYTNGLMNGMGISNGMNRFKPDDTTTRAMLVTLLYRLEGEPKTTGSNPFRDVPAGKYYTNAVIWAVEHGVTTGVTELDFKPDDHVTRQQMAAFLYRYAAFAGYDTKRSASLDAFPDAGEISAYAAAPMRWAVATQLINGKPKGSEILLAPADHAPRAQVAAIFMRYMENIVQAE